MNTSLKERLESLGFCLAVTVIVGLLLILGLSGCTTQAVKHGNVISVTERFVGVKVSESPRTELPQLVLGWGSVNLVMLPTSTNNLCSPNFANTFRFSQRGILRHEVTEELASGAMQTLQPDATNSAVTITPRKID